MNCSVADIGGEILAVSQFTLYTSTKKGNRPSWGRAARGDVFLPLFNQFMDRLSTALGSPVTEHKLGLFQWGTVTLLRFSLSLGVIQLRTLAIDLVFQPIHHLADYDDAARNDGRSSRNHAGKNT